MKLKRLLAKVCKRQKVSVSSLTELSSQHHCGSSRYDYPPFLWNDADWIFVALSSLLTQIGLSEGVASSMLLNIYFHEKNPGGLYPLIEVRQKARLKIEDYSR
mmetsp:Transcript_40113/g.64457  ORF Transcript_40113/g.64457 Transcript_40113/m.64457 type:complete len:103 (-) Transcript_40113:780-1088(-)